MQIFLSQSYFWNSILGVIAAGVGLSVLLFSLFRWKTKEFSLTAFGTTSLLYGVRLVVETQLDQYTNLEPPQALLYTSAFIAYLLPVPLSVFLLQLFGNGWKNSMVWVFRTAEAFAVIALLSDIIQATPFSLTRINSTLVIVWALVIFRNAFWKGMKKTRELQVVLFGFIVFGLFAVNENLVGLKLLPWDWSEEAIGFLAFLLSLGYVAGLRFFTNEARLLTIDRDMEIARQIQSSILPRTLPTIHGLQLAARYVPMTSVAGDFYDVLQVDEKRLCILVADVSGHGVGAALIASMLKVAFASQRPVLADPARVLAGLNHALADKLESNFVTAGCLFIDTGARELRYASGGHPPMILHRRSTGNYREVGKHGLLLGPFPEATYESTSIAIKPRDRLILYTDGIIESTNASDSFFGDGQFKQFIELHGDLTPGDFADTLLQRVSEWSGKPVGESLDDDLTLVVVDVK
jgi:sigma-B regulation protein RsbU (phosphoserine phosphatase)